ncbi:hypothetical protein B0H14DRAFT_2645778 [Mycena olivaceomarginata]|nr:hypothetical protein B0H14DRAFT_2645778 [Mycena olivaceomarginata]
MSFRLSVKELNEENDARGGPPLQFSSHILQDSDEPDLPPIFYYVDWTNLIHPSTVSMGAVNTNLQTPDHLQSTAVPPDVIVPDAHSEDCGALPVAVALEHVSPGTVISDGAPVTGRVPGPFFPSQASTSSNVQNHPVEGVLAPEFNGHILCSSTFNAAHVLEPTSNVHQPHSNQTISTDPAPTYLPGYQAVVSPIFMGPI